MLKGILKLKGTQALSKSQQKNIEGSGLTLIPHGELRCGERGDTCPSGYCCGRGQNIRYACVIAQPGEINCL